MNVDTTVMCMQFCHVVFTHCIMEHFGIYCYNIEMFEISLIYLEIYKYELK